MQWHCVVFTQAVHVLIHYVNLVMFSLLTTDNIDLVWLLSILAVSSCTHTHSIRLVRSESSELISD